MDMEGALRARIVDASTTADDRVSWDERPQSSALPAVTLQIIDGARSQHLKGYNDLQRTPVQLDCWAESYEAAKALKESVLAAIVPEQSGNGIRFDRAIEDRARSGGERAGEKFVFRQSVDLGIWWAPAP